MITNEDLIQLAEDLEIHDRDILLPKLLDSQFVTLSDLYTVMDDSLDDGEMFESFCNQYILITDSHEIMELIRKVLVETKIDLDTIIEQILNAESETQLIVTLKMMLIKGDVVPMPSPELGQLIYYNLVDINEHMASLKHIYKELN